MDRQFIFIGYRKPTLNYLPIALCAHLGNVNYSGWRMHTALLMKMTNTEDGDPKLRGTRPRMCK